MPYRLILLGTPRLLASDGKKVSFPEKALVLAAHLLLSKEAYTASRAEAALFLWEDADSPHAALNLRQLISRIRARQSELDLQLYAMDEDTIRIDAAAADVDLLAFHRLIAQGSQGHIEALCRAYGGDLLTGVDIAGAEARARMEAHRTRLRHLFVEEASTQLDSAGTGLPTRGMRAAAELVLDLDPYNERACRALLRALGREGQVRVAREVYTEFSSRLRAELGVEPDIETAQVAALACGMERRPVPTAPAEPSPPTSEAVAAPAQQVSPVPRLALLPAGQIVSEEDADGLGASLVDDVTIGLCSLRSVTVLAPLSAWKVANSDDPSGFLTQFSIDYVAECRISRHFGEPSLFLQLYKSRRREIVWAERFALAPNTVASDYRQMTARIVSCLAGAVERLALESLALERNPGAYPHFLLGQRQLTVVDLPRVRRARKLFQLALSESPGFAPAYSGLARTFHLEWLLLARREPELLDHAVRLAAKAVALDPVDARGHRELGVAELYARHFDQSIDALSLAEASSPQFADVLADYADTLIHADDPEIGLQRIEKAIALNPLCPDDYWWTAGGAYYLLGDYKLAIERLMRMSDTRPANRLIAACWAMLGDKAEALKYVRRVRQEHPDFRIEDWLAIVPFRYAEQRAHYEEGLRRAGFQ
jgi:DNA-binding SARP family transcriptional activator/TolB-like protein